MSIREPVPHAAERLGFNVEERGNVLQGNALKNMRLLFE